MRTLQRSALRLLALLLLLGGATAFAQPALLLSSTSTSVDAWPVLRVLPDPGAQLDAAQALERLDQFTAPTVPKASFGQYRGALWLWLPISVNADAGGLWLADLDYPPLDRIDVHLLRDGKIVGVEHLGDHLPGSLHPIAARTHAAPLTLEPGSTQALLLRVETSSAMLVPLRLVKAANYHASEMGTHLAQGLLAGVGLCFALYSLIHLFSLRDRLFLDYALSVASITLFFLAYHGLAAQHLWGDSDWLTRNSSGLAVLFALVGAFLFLDRALDVASLSRSISLALRGGALTAGGVAAAFVAGLIDYHTAQLCATLLGPCPMLAGVPVAFIRARQGDRAARYMQIGWAGYGAGSLTMTGLQLGLIGANPLTVHAAQAGAVFEMALWMLVLGVRIDELRRKAEHAGIERDRLQSMALSDPLTGVPNRRGLQTALEERLAGCHAQRLSAVYLLDLDEFKPVNDRFGHDTGDALLIEIARRLQQCTRASDVVARVGGDEFVVVVDMLPTEDEAEAIGSKLLAAFETPFAAAGQLCKVGATIGYAVAPLDGLDAGRLIKAADAAMYAGKQAGGRVLRRGPLPGGLLAT